MEKYLRYLHADIEDSIDRSPPVSEYGWIPFFPDEEDEAGVESCRFITVAELTGIPAEAFPPEKLLTDDQVLSLLEAIEKLWKAWNLTWEMPLYLPERKQYTAFIREIKDNPVAYHPDRGGKVQICDFEGGKTCPFQPDDGYCFCKYIDDCVKHDIAIWEEHVRSQGIDPYRELSPEEEKAFEEEMRLRDLRKRYGDDWRKYANYESRFNPEDEFEDDFFDEKYFDEEEDEFGWDDDFFFSDDGPEDWKNEDSAQQDEEDDGCDMPF